ncbi:16S rRNA (cytidine(1402)-2'-O)-methyltransferase [Virgibacillus sp. W0181]|uniref:16S rRNA (cytidine(1402)-2'-O)-methyltransferase n=1 Tax=Virgibacillus sp. W0181 TaxID=3391581 RepID=UPI003F452C2D
MQIQKSFDQQNSTGTIYVVPTPIGNLEDITYRALTVLKTVQWIAAEDTRNTKNLLRHFDIHTPLVSYHEHSKASREHDLLDRLANGESIALVSDAGMPTISDPGNELIQAAISERIPVISLPGANAALCALVASGLSTTEFLFHGFLPRKKKEKIAALENLQTMKATLLFYESPYRLTDTLGQLQAVFGNRQAVIGRELTKRFEEYVRGTMDELLSWSRETELKGEFCIVVEGSNQDQSNEDSLWWSHLSVQDHVYYYMENNKLTSKDAIKQVATDRKMAKRNVYQQFHMA